MALRHEHEVLGARGDEHIEPFIYQTGFGERNGGRSGGRRDRRLCSYQLHLVLFG